MTLEERARELVKIVIPATGLWPEELQQLRRKQYIPDILAALQAVERETLERAADVVTQCNRDGPYQAIGAAPMIMDLATSNWKNADGDCWEPMSCIYHNVCMYPKGPRGRICTGMTPNKENSEPRDTEKP